MRKYIDIFVLSVMILAALVVQTKSESYINRPPNFPFALPKRSVCVFKDDTMSKKIPLTQDKCATLDDADFTRLSNFKWCAYKGGNAYYAVRSSKRQNGKRKQIYMHREILGLKASDSRQTDHINGNGLDNRRSNLRICTHAQNQHNRHSIRGKSKFKGCSWNKSAKKWQAHISFEGRLIFLGYFDSEIEAAEAYDAKAKELFSEFAYVNFPEEA